MRGDKITPKPIVVAATIIDEQGRDRYYIIPSKLWSFSVACIALVLVIVALLAMLVVYNKAEIEGLKQQIRVEENSNK